MGLSLGIHEEQKRGLREGSVGAVFAYRPDDWSLIPDPHGGMREPTLKSCFLASTYQYLNDLSKAHAHTNPQKKKIKGELELKSSIFLCLLTVVAMSPAPLTLTSTASPP